MISNSNIKIEKATKENVMDIVKIHKECISKINSKTYPGSVIKEWLGQVTKQNVLDQLDTSKWLVIREKDNIVGFCQYDLGGEELYQIQILPKYQGKGYGKYFYDFIEKDFVHNNVNKISLFATLNAVPFYESMGFKRVKPIEFRLRNETLNMLEMSKSIADLLSKP